MRGLVSSVAKLSEATAAGLASTRSLKDAIIGIQKRDVTLRRLLEETEATESVLFALEDLLQTSHAESPVDTSMTVLLQRPIEGCSRIYSGVEEAMGRFAKESSSPFLDWTKMECMGENVNQVLDIAASYKATISVGLRAVTLRLVEFSPTAHEECEQLVQNTIYDLNIQMQRLDDKINNLVLGSVPDSLSKSISWNSERQVIEQCLQICQDARLYLDSVANIEPVSFQENTLGTSINSIQTLFDTQVLTRQALEENQAGLVKVITCLRERLETVVLNGAAAERSQLQEDIEMSTKCLEACKLASQEVSSQKIHVIGELFADEDSDLVAVTSTADLFSIGKVTSRNRSAVLTGSMSEEALMRFSSNRYNSKFGSSKINDSSELATERKGEAPSRKTSNSQKSSKSQQLQYETLPITSNDTRKRVAVPISGNEQKSEEKTAAPDE